MGKNLSLGNGKAFLTRINGLFGNRLVLLLTAVFFIEEGIIYSLIVLNQLPYFKNVLKINETMYQTFFLISWSPWSMKAISGIFSDLYPLLGYNKTSYMLCSGFLGCVALLVLSVVKIENTGLFIIAPAMLFCVNLELSVLDLLCEGRYTKILHEKKIKEGDIITWVWVCRIMGQLIGGSIIGVFVTNFNPRNVYWICFACSFPVIFMLLAGFLGETKQRNWLRKFDTKKFKRQKNLFSLAFLIAICSVGMIFVNLYSNAVGVLSYSFVTSSLVLVTGFLVLPRTLAKVNFYIFIQEALYLRIMGALDYWYTADHSCVPGGPNFNMTFYLTVTQIIGCISGVVGVLIFQNCTKNWTFVLAFLFSALVKFIGSLFDLFIVTRTNLKFHLSDKTSMIFGDAIIMDIAFMLTKMPAVLLTARLVSRGYEATIYATLAGYHDFGKAVAMSLGTIMMKYYQIDFDARPCNYANLPMLVAVSHSFLPLIAIPFVFFLIPNVKLNDIESLERLKGGPIDGEEGQDGDDKSQGDGNETFELEEEIEITTVTESPDELRQR